MRTLAFQAHMVEEELCLQTETAIRMVTVVAVEEVLYSAHQVILLQLVQEVGLEFLRGQDILITLAVRDRIMEQAVMEQYL